LYASVGDSHSCGPRVGTVVPYKTGAIRSPDHCSRSYRGGGLAPGRRLRGFRARLLGHLFTPGAIPRMRSPLSPPADMPSHGDTSEKCPITDIGQ
jgi:hypothetical protein